jgi:hypothetical protein
MLRSTRRAMLSGLLLGTALGAGCGGNPLNTPPRGTYGPRARASEAFSGEVVYLATEVVDDEGDPITFVWSQLAPTEPQGTFSDTSVSSPTWTAPVVTQPTYFTLQLLVSDDHENTIQGKVGITVRPRAQ